MTTSCVDLEEVKRYLKVEHTADDEVLEMLAESATSLVETRLRRSVIGDVVTGALAVTADDVPKAVKLSVLIIVSYLYENRDATDEQLRSRVLRQAALDAYVRWDE